MAQDYNTFFKNAKKTRAASVTEKSRAKKAKKDKAKEDETAEDFLRRALNVKETRKPARLRAAPILIFLGLVMMGACGYFAWDQSSYLKGLISRVDFQLFSTSFAQNKSAGGEKNSATTAETGDKNAESSILPKGPACTEIKAFTEEELSHFNKLSERKKELDRREQDLAALEEELHKQKAEVEQRIGKLEQIRDEVSTVLKERVEIDQQRVGTLVDFYSNMKPKQAAEIFAKLNEDLAVEVLGRMKKKNAADILNLVEPKKARALSEKFTGYTRR